MIRPLLSSVPFLPAAGSLIVNGFFREALTSGGGGVNNRQEISPFQTCVDVAVDRAGFRVTSTGTSTTARIYVIVYGADEKGRPAGPCLAQSDVIDNYDGAGYYDAPIDFTFERYKRYWVGVWWEVSGRNIAEYRVWYPMLDIEMTNSTPRGVNSLRRTAVPDTPGVSPDWVYAADQNNRFSDAKGVFFRAAA